MDPFMPCTKEQVCQFKKFSNIELTYRPRKINEGYIENWWVQYDLICKSQTEIKGCVSFFFVGFVVGIPSLFLPDQLGRKKALGWTLFISVIANYLVTYGESLEIKKMGFFIMGVL